MIKLCSVICIEVHINESPYRNFIQTQEQNVGYEHFSELDFNGRHASCVIAPQTDL